MFVTTLPITPTLSTPFLRMSTPLFADIIANALGSPLFLFVNTTGLKTSFVADEQQAFADLYQTQLRSLGIVPDRLDHDGSQGYAKFFDEVQKTLLAKNALSNKTEEIAWCPCGRVEIPARLISELLSKKHGLKRLVSGTETEPRCAVCLELLRISSDDVLQLALSCDSPLKIFPSLYQQQMESNLSFARSFPWVASRKHRVGTDLDSEFRWLPFLAYLSQTGEQDVVLVTSQNTMNKAVKVAALASMLVPSLHVHIVVHPLIRIQAGRVPFVAKTLQEYLDLCEGRQIARAFLALAMQWTDMETQLPAQDLHWVKTSLAKKADNVLLEKRPTSFRDVFSQCNRNQLLLILKLLRSQQALSEEQNNFLQSVLGRASS